ncbi:MAG TPA: PAS domain-containing sensor histidine kinase [Vicinamibacterales bacterium]|nr:PAS domain-containing sensor histidine kinase [Vicinamibacterales bacterium]
MHTSAASVVSPHGLDTPAGKASVEARLALTEFLLASSDLHACARQAIDWLAAQTGTAQAMVVVIDPMSQNFLLVAERGVASDALADFSLSRDDAGHPLVRAMDRPDPTYFSPSSVTRSPLDGIGFHAVPLRADDGGPVHGILLAAASSPEVHQETVWLSRQLSRQAGRFTHPGPAEIGFGQERMLLYSIINAVTDPILLTDTEGKLIIANTHAEKLFAAPEDASEGWRRAVALNNMLFSAALSTSAVTQTDLARRELLLVDPLEGSDLLFELLSSRARDERQGTYVVSILRNITDLARAREEIEESYRTLRLAQAEVRDERHRLDLIIDSVADPILVTDPEGDIVLMNEPAERLFNVPVTADESAQRSVRANGANLTSFVSNVLTRTGEQRYRGEIQLTDPASGRGLPVEALAGTILSEQGELVWVVTILHDLTEALEREGLYRQLKHASEELERKVQEATAELAQQNELLRRQHIELEQASNLKSQFLANISHEFRTPLNAILGYTHMLLHGVTGAATEPQRKSLTRIDSNSRHLLALINDILDITRIEAGRMPLNVTRFKIVDLVDEVMSELEPIIRRSNLTVTTKTARASLPLVRTDRQKVKQIVLNLLSNALKFTPTGSVTIATAFERKTKMLAIIVRDTGVGIPEESQGKIFEDFRQLDNSPTRGYGGTGLGLSICRRLAQMLGGSIDVVSTLGEGSTFTFRLPVRARRR